MVIYCPEIDNFLPIQAVDHSNGQVRSLIMIRDQNEGKFKEAQQLRDECYALLQGRY